MNQYTRVLLALVAGLAIGVLVEASQSDNFRWMVGLIEPLGKLWTNAIQMCVVPLVLALIINGIASTEDTSVLGQVGKKIVPVFLVMLLAGGALAILVGIPSMSGLTIPADVANSLRAGATAGANATPPAMPSVAQRIIETVPVNPIKAAADAAMLPLLVFAVLFAVALTRVSREHREPIVSFFRALGDAMLVLVRWVLLVAPVGVFALALGLGMRMGASAAAALVYYIVVLSGVMIVFVILIYPAVRLMCGIPIRRFAVAAAEAQGIAISSRSSLAAVSAVITGARDQLGAPPHVTGFVIPLAVSVFRPNVPMAWVIGVLFLGKLYGVDVGIPELIEVVAISTFLSFSVPGIPSASLFLLAPVLEGIGIPGAGAAVLIAVDAIPDMFKTTVNVSSHLAVAGCMSKGAAGHASGSATG